MSFLFATQSLIFLWTLCLIQHLELLKVLLYFKEDNISSLKEKLHIAVQWKFWLKNQTESYTDFAEPVQNSFTVLCTQLASGLTYLVSSVLLSLCFKGKAWRGRKLDLQDKSYLIIKISDLPNNTMWKTAGSNMHEKAIIIFLSQPTQDIKCPTSSLPRSVLLLLVIVLKTTVFA